eukprot:3887952-Rhodomonas_salina.1
MAASSSTTTGPLVVGLGVHFSPCSLGVLSADPEGRLSALLPLFVARSPLLTLPQELCSR